MPSVDSEVLVNNQRGPNFPHHVEAKAKIPGERSGRDFWPRSPIRLRRPLASDMSIEDLLAGQRALVTRCREDAEACLEFNEAIVKKMFHRGEMANGVAVASSSSFSRFSPNTSSLFQPLLGGAPSCCAMPGTVSMTTTPRSQPDDSPNAREANAQYIRQVSPSGMRERAPSGLSQREMTDGSRASLFHQPAMSLRDRVVSALKQKEKTYEVEKLYHDAGRCQVIARSVLFQNITLAVIFFNCIWMGIETDYNDATILCQAPLIFQVVDNLFCMFFAFEIVVRFGAFKVKCDAFHDRWFLFDSLLALLMVWETWIEVALFLVIGESGYGRYNPNRLLPLRSLRLLRLTRVARLVKVLRAFPELMVLAKAMVMALRSVGAAIALLVIIIYIFSILFTQILSDTETGKGHFDNIPQTFDTLLMMGVFTEQREFFEHMLDGSLWYYFLFMLYLAVTSYTVLNMLLGIICEVIADVTAREKEDLLISELTKRLSSITELLAHDKVDLSNEESKVTREYFLEIMHYEEVTEALSEVGVDVLALVDLADFIFPEDGDIELSQFLQILLQFRGSNSATVKDIVDMRKYVLNELHNLEQRQSKP